MLKRFHEIEITPEILNTVKKLILEKEKMQQKDTDIRSEHQIALFPSTLFKFSFSNLQDHKPETPEFVMLPLTYPEVSPF